MQKTKISIEQVDEIFQSGDLIAQIEFLDQLECVDYDPIIVTHLCSYLPKANKGLRNALSNFIKARKCYFVADKLTEFISSNDINLRNIAGEILISFGKFAVDSLIKFLKKNKNEFNIKFAADILAVINDKKVEDVVLELINTTEDENILISYIEALGNNRSLQSIDLLISLYNKSQILKPYIISSLGKIGTLKALNFIIQIYNEEDELVKYMIIESLGDIGNEESFFFLLSELQNASLPFVPPILEAIYKLHVRFGFDIPYDEKMKRAILILFSNKENEYRKIGAKLLYEFDDTDIISEALKYYGSDQDYDGIILNKLFNNKLIVLKQISQLLKNEIPNTLHLLKLVYDFIQEEYDLVKELNEIEINKLVDSISRCLSHSDEMVRYYAIELLFKLNVDIALMLISDKFLNENFWIKLRLTELLEEIDHNNSNEILERLSLDENEIVRQRAIELLTIKKKVN